ncbi:MAG: tryptophan--tRNA ligase [Methanocellales archaeon]
MAAKLDPWGAISIEDYSKLFEEFGISPFEELLPRIPDPHPYMRRKIIFGHRGYELVLNAMLKGEKFAVMSGFMPSGKAHLGHKMVMDEIIWHQKKGAQAFYAVADMEAHAVRGISWKQCREIGINDYILSLIALGFEPINGYIYFQSENEQVKNLAFELGIEANYSEMQAIYGFTGETHISHIQSVLVQAADILEPQLKEFQGPKPVVIPVGTDQDPHIRITRDLASRMKRFSINIKNEEIRIYSKSPDDEGLKLLANCIKEQQQFEEILLYRRHISLKCKGEIKKAMDKLTALTREVEISQGGYGFYPPASIYHRFMTGLTGGKMSSSIPESVIALSDDPGEAADKVKKAKTGGRVTINEQKKLGGEPEKCTVYELMLFHLIESDREIKEIYESCKTGERMCGTCKQYAAELIAKFLREHQAARERARERLREYGLKY